MTTVITSSYISVISIRVVWNDHNAQASQIRFIDKLPPEEYYMTENSIHCGSYKKEIICEWERRGQMIEMIGKILTLNTRDRVKLFEHDSYYTASWSRLKPLLFCNVSTIFLSSSHRGVKHRQQTLHARQNIARLFETYLNNFAVISRPQVIVIYDISLSRHKRRRMALLWRRHRLRYKMEIDRNPFMGNLQIEIHPSE